MKGHEPIVWSYWEGPRLPYISLCLLSMAKVLGKSFRLVTPETLHEYLAPEVLHPSYRTLAQPALRADCIRAALLAVHGGWWWDADTIALNHPWFLCYRYSKPILYTTWTRRPRRILNGYIYMAPGSPAATRWLAQVNEFLASSSGNVSWCSLGEQLITEDLTADPTAQEFPREIVLRIDIDSSVEHFFNRSPYAGLAYTAACFGLNHSYFVYHHPEAFQGGPTAWSKSRLFIHQLLSYAAERYL